MSQCNMSIVPPLYQRLSPNQSYRPLNHLTDKSFAHELLRRIAFIFVVVETQKFRNRVANDQREKRLDFRATLIKGRFCISNYTLPRITFIIHRIKRGNI